MRILLFIFALVLTTSVSTESRAQTFDTTLHFRCAGTVKIAKDRGRKTVWRERVYQINGHVHLAVRDGRVINETHNFVRTGYLWHNGRPKFSGLSIDGQFALYEAEYYYLKIPVNGTDVWFMQKYNKPLGVGGSNQLWQRLSNVEVEANN